MNEKLNNYLKKLRNHCTNNKIPIISPNTENFLKNFVSANNFKNILEIGSAVWYSTIFFANLIKQNNWQIISFEISQPAYFHALNNIFNSWLNNIKIYNFDFLKTNTDLIFFDKKFDFVFVDARKSEYLDYFKKILKYCHPNTKIIFDDVIKFKEKMPDLVFYCKKNNFNYQKLKLDNDDWILIVNFW